MDVLHVPEGGGSGATGLTSPPFRGRGCQTALVRRRMRNAATADCDILVSQCRPSGVRERNQHLVSVRVAGIKASCVRPPIPAG